MRSREIVNLAGFYLIDSLALKWNGKVIDRSLEPGVYINMQNLERARTY